MRKVTVGFKCHPELKQTLINNARLSGVSLSEFVENLCENQSSLQQQVANVHEQMEDLRDENSRLRKELAVYEIELLGPWFEQYEDQTLKAKLPNGQVSDLHIQSPKDLLKAILIALEDK